MPIAAVDYGVIRDLIFAKAGIVLAPGSEYLVESRLAPVAREAGMRGLSDLAQRLRETKNTPLHARVVEAMTTNETSFFRDVHPFEALRQQLLPELIQKRAGERKLAIWCAAASSGQEPYSVAMLLREHFAELRTWSLSFLATDLSTEMLARCREGVFSGLELARGLSPALRKRFFEPKGENFQISADLRGMIEFKPLNLTEVWPRMPKFDLVFMRNVLIYFDNATKSKILTRVRSQLAPDGALLLGSTETTLKLDNGFEPVRVDRTVVFRPRGVVQASAGAGAAAAPRASAAPASPAARAAAAKARPSRAHPRFQLPCFAAFEQGATPGRGIIADISQTGVRLDRPVPALAVGARVKLTIQLLDGEPAIEVEASVVRTTPTGVGLQFAPGSAEQQRIGECLVLRTAAAGAKK
jgi:chemotaxis protein methyltransferase CheR